MSGVDGKAEVALLSTGLNVTDIDRSLAFYAKVFGLVEINRYELADLTEVVLRAPAQLDGPGLILVSHHDPDQPAASLDSFGRIVFLVPDARVTWELALAGGGTSVREPGTFEGFDVTVAIVRDPDGVSLELVQRPVRANVPPESTR